MSAIRKLAVCVGLVAVLLAPSLVSAQADGGWAHIRFTVHDRDQLDRLTHMLSIDAVRGHEVWGYATPAQLEGLRKAGIVWDVIEDDLDERQIVMCPAGWDTNPSRTWDCYPTYSQYTSIMQGFATNYPALCELHSLGATTNQVRPHELLAVKISDNVAIEEDEPEVLYASTMHGDETTGWVLTLRLIDELLTGYGSDPELTAMVDDLEIWINPLHNPDGTYYGSDTSVSSAIRSYTNSSGGGSGPDPNRNFPDPEDGDHPDGSAWWTETEAMMAFAEAHSFILSANFHGGIEVLNYPWDTWQRRHADDTWLIDICRHYADLAQAASPYGYMDDLNNGITNGYDWYTTSGNRQDFMTYFHGSREVTIEISTTKLPASTSLPDYWSWNRQALLDWLKEAREGVRGLVTDTTGTPLAATIEVLGHDVPEDNSMARTDPDVGDYHRMLLPGTYDLRFSAYGHLTQDYPSIVVSSGDAVRQDVILVPLPSFTVSGVVTTPSPESNIGNATVELLGTPFAPATTAGDGSYSFDGVFEGTYTFRVSAAGFETIEVDRLVEAGSTTHDFALAPLEIEYETDLEISDGGLNASGAPATPGWQWGIPSSVGPSSAHSGTKVWATNISGDYSSSAHWYLRLNAATIPSNQPQLAFWHWYDIEKGSNDYDGGNVSISTDGGSNWDVLIPEGGYPSSNVSALGQAGFTGSSGGWTEAVFDLDSYAGLSASIRWHFASDGSVEEPGWYLDDIALAGVSYEADFGFTPEFPLPGQTVAFSDRSTGPVQSWSWTFDDGGSSSEQNPSHSFAADGVYWVTLEVGYGGSTDTRVHPVEVGADIVIFRDGFEGGDASGWDIAIGD